MTKNEWILETFSRLYVKEESICFDDAYVYLNNLDLTANVLEERGYFEKEEEISNEQLNPTPTPGIWRNYNGPISTDEEEEFSHYNRKQ